MLYATRINKEYVNEDELAKSRVREFYRKQNEAMYGEEKETKMSPGALSSQLKYGIDSLFENFRNAVEQVLAADYNGDLTQQKTYEVIKKYNQLSSYLKNVIDIKALTKDDQDKIEKEFEGMRDKLLLLKKIATDNNFIDKDDISDMVDTILKIKVMKGLEKVSSQSVGMVENIKSKNESLQLIQDSINNLATIDTDLQNPALASSTKLKNQTDLYNALNIIFNNPDLNPLEFAQIRTDAKRVTDLLNDIKSDIVFFENIRKKLESEGKYIEDVSINGFDSLTLPNMRTRLEKITDELKTKIKESEQKQIDKLDTTDPNYAANAQKITDKWKKELDKLDQANINLELKAQVTIRDTEYKSGELPRIYGEYQKTNTYADFQAQALAQAQAQANPLVPIVPIVINGTLNENQLLDEETKLGDIRSDLNKLEATLLAQFNNMTSLFIKSVKFTKPVITNIPQQKTPAKTQKPKAPAVVSVDPAEPFKTPASFVAYWKKMMDEKNAGSRKFTGYLAKKSTMTDATIRNTHWLYYRDKLTRMEQLKFWE